MKIALSCLAAAMIVAWPGVGLGQQRDGFPQMPGDMTPAEVQQLFDAFELVRAQEMLGLTEEQYPEFVVRLKALQDGRRDGQRQRQRLLRDLQHLAGQPGTDDDTLQQRLDELSALDASVAARRREAETNIDAILDVRQRVRFRMFQEAIERRRLELLMRARRSQQRPQQRQPRDRF